MRTIALVAVAALMIPLGSCAALQKLSSTQVPAKTILVAVNSFDAAEITAKNFIVYCSPNPSPKGCDDGMIKNKLVPAIKAGRVARDNLNAFVAAHPGQLGDVGTYDAVISATTTIQQVVAALQISH